MYNRETYRDQQILAHLSEFLWCVQEEAGLYRLKTFWKPNFFLLDIEAYS